MSKFELHNPEVICQECGQNIVIPKVPTEKPLPGQTRASWLAEQWDQIAPMLIQRGWVVRKNEVGGRFALCKPCSLKETPAIAPLPEFSVKPKCVICGNRQASVKFCDGRHRGCAAGNRHHVHRTCNKCGYSWAELPRSQSNERNGNGNEPDSGSNAGQVDRDSQTGGDSGEAQRDSDRSQAPQEAVEAG